MLVRTRSLLQAVRRAPSQQLSCAFSTTATTEGMDQEKLSEIEKEYKTEIDQIYQDYEERQKKKNSIIGVVVSTMCQKSISVQYFHSRYYPKYQATLPVRRKVMAHDEGEVCRLGDLVRVVPCRPMSKMKRHSLYEVIRKAKRLDDSADRREKMPKMY